MTSFAERHINYYKPLVKEFLNDVEKLAHPNIKGLPEPFLPLFGKSYEKSAMRLVIIGQDSKVWGDLIEFIDNERNCPGCKLEEKLSVFSTHKFRKWGRTRQHFWGFTMMLLSELHGQEEWTSMKYGKMVEILDSFAWAEANAIELYDSTARRLGASKEYWDLIRQAGERFNKFDHIVQTLKPNVAIILYRGLNPENYFEGYKYDVVNRDGRLTHYHLSDIEVDVFHAPHPRSMNMNEGVSQFIDKIKGLFVRLKIAVPFPKFTAGQDEGIEVMEFFRNKAQNICSDFDKYAFVNWVAEELTKRNAFMSVPALIDLVNSKGGRTNYGTLFSGGRGSYRLISATYDRLNKYDKLGAQRVADAFLKPNFEYAYNTNQ